MAGTDDLNKGVEDFGKNIDNLSTSFKYTLAQIKSLGKGVEAGGAHFIQFVNASKELGNNLKDNKDLMEKIVEGEIDANKAKELQKESQEKHNKLLEKARTIRDKMNDEGSKASDSKKKAMDHQIKRLKYSAIVESNQMKKALDQAKKGESRVSKELSGMAGKMKSWGLKGTADHFEKMAVSARKSKQEGGSLAKTVDKKLVGGLEKFGKMNWFGMLVGLLVEAGRAMLKVNQEVTELGRGLGVSLPKARDIRQHFVNLEADAGKLKLTYEDIMKSSNALNKSLGTSATMISGDILIGMAQMETRMHMTTEATMGFAKAAIASKKTVFDLRDSALEGALATEKEFGVRVDLRKVLEKTGKISGQLRGIYGNNFNLLSKTVAKAQLLGMTMKEVASSSKSMLNFQSSIESEMKAELFLGRQLNLEQARLAALTGDHATYMDEIVKNAGDFVDFSQMNVMQQNALAEAMGMSTDQLADMLLQQADLNSLKEKARDIGADEAASRLEEISAQEALNGAMEKLKNIFINLMAKIEDFEVPKLLGKLLGVDEGTKIFKGLTEVAEDTTAKGS